MRPFSLLFLGLAAAASADTLTLLDGTFLRGRIERVADGQLELRVQGWGGSEPLRIPLARIESFRTDEAVRLSGRRGAVLDGVAWAVGGRVASSGGAETFAQDATVELWREPGARPAEGRPDTPLDDAGRPRSVGSFRRGPRQRFQRRLPGEGHHRRGHLGRAASAWSAPSPGTRLRLTTSTSPWAMKRTRPSSSTGTRGPYTGYDNARQVDFLPVNAAGLGLRLFTDARGKLDTRIGLAHRYENYSLAGQPSLATPSMDLGLLFEREFGWAKMQSTLSLVPSFASTQNFYVRHESALNIFRGDGPPPQGRGLQ
jgi:hypothetical protein